MENSNLAGQMKRASLVYSGLSAIIQGGLAYWIYNNYWDKSAWGKFGALWFGLGSAYSVAGALGVVATPTEILANQMAKKEQLAQGQQQEQGVTVRGY